MTNRNLKRKLSVSIVVLRWLNHLYLSHPELGSNLIHGCFKLSDLLAMNGGVISLTPLCFSVARLALCICQYHNSLRNAVDRPKQARYVTKQTKRKLRASPWS